jgi:peptidylprolyl isomerase
MDPVLHLRRPAALLVPTLLLASTALAACGDESAEETATGFDAVSVSGPVGETPEVEWKADLAESEAEAEVLVEGDGEELEEGDTVLVNLAVSDDFTEEVSYDTFGEDEAGFQLVVGAEATEPTQAIDLIKALVGEQVEAGTTLGTRIAMTVDAKEEWGQTALALSELDLGNEDGLVIVVDLESTVLDGPDGARKAAPAWAPEVVETKGEPTSLDSAGLPRPNPAAKVARKAIVVQGDGPEVRKGDVVAVDYLGQVWGGDEPFDESYSKDSPLVTGIGLGNLVKGWDDGLIGVPVGSRVLLQIPPKLGYGKQGSGENIKGDDTMYFVVDVLGAA